ncbi:mechanosensitive ion channel domain-containing protein [Fodinicola feengrottensis]|uniref:mechanosensitive ion channel domain-containing protein n=1 Tax=Fodinicola feengrottensis TaxID=435914 RepID=UPI0013D54E94|nr:mechanosensitive ion channel family protein [Fodinicola feengrottensis]
MVAVRSVGSVAAGRIQRRLSAGHAAALRLAVSLCGYIGLAIVVLNTLGVDLGQLLVGGALTGVVIGIAAQQSLGNVFAGVVLMSSQPFSVGDHVVVHSGALGGPHRGQVTEMGLVYLTLETETGPIRLPNSAVLNSAVAQNGTEPE